MLKGRQLDLPVLSEEDFAKLKEELKRNNTRRSKHKYYLKQREKVLRKRELMEEKAYQKYLQEIELQKDIEWQKRMEERRKCEEELDRFVRNQRQSCMHT